ncbi:MAG: ORF6N domain-containing protein, partial [Treponema sp.]|nr:ORF6N domain-containing protein [Treponema sp.]
MENREIKMENEIISTEGTIKSKILVIRGQQVMIDRDLAQIYGVETKRLNEQVKRNIERFPENFCFQL